MDLNESYSHELIKLSPSDVKGMHDHNYAQHIVHREKQFMKQYNLNLIDVLHLRTFKTPFILMM